MTGTTENLKQKNAEYASKFDQGDLAVPPAKSYLILTCMDARIDANAAFGVGLGDAHVIRNAGGSAHDALRSIVISQQLLHTKEVLLIKHTDCGMTHFENEDARATVVKNLGEEAGREVAGTDFLPFKDLDQAVRDDVAYLKNSRLVPNSINISGWVYDVKTGKVLAVD